MHVSSLPSGPDTIRILITTDNHVGYNENDPIRSDDSWKTFQEVTYLAKEHDVDMILQGGDLFHINKPSKKSMYHVMRSLRLNCMGDKPCELELLSDPELAFGGDGFNTVNYEDPNLNVSIPVFAISGNHDDATGEGLLSPMDLLSVAGLVNHFGKVHNNDDITVSPLLFQKGSTKLSLYGMANVRDERLFKSFRDGKVKFLRPNTKNADGSAVGWFNLMCVHQNHSAHTNTSYLPESFLPGFLDMVVWGHEHECIPYPVANSETGFETLQPGSSVATSLCEGEAVEKNVFVLNVRGSDYSLEPLLLRTVRPFVMEEVSLRKEGVIPGPASKEDIVKLLTHKVEELIERANAQYREKNPDLFEDEDSEQSNESAAAAAGPAGATGEAGTATTSGAAIPLPLVRLRVEYSGGYEVGNPRRFSNKFVGRVANVNDVVQFYKKRGGDSAGKRAGVVAGGTVRFEDTDAHGGADATLSSEVHVKELMNEFLRQTQLTLLPEDGMNNAVANFLNQEDKHILKKYIDKEMKSETQLLLDVNVDYDSYYGKSDAKVGEVFRSVLSEINRAKARRPEASWDSPAQPGSTSTRTTPSTEPVIHSRASAGVAARTTKPKPAAAAAATTNSRRSAGARGKRAAGKSKEVVSDSDDGLGDVDVQYASEGDDSGSDVYVDQNDDDDDDDDDREMIILSDSEEEEVAPKRTTARTARSAKPAAAPARAASKRAAPAARSRAAAAKPKPKAPTKAAAKKKAPAPTGKRSVLDDLMDI